MRIAALLVLLLAACAHAPAPQKQPWFGMRKFAAAEVCMPAGEQLWLSRLRCPDGAPPKIVSSTSAGARTNPETPDDPRQLAQLDVGRPLAPGEPDFHIVDAFVISCSDGDRTLFLDMYHCTQEPPASAPEGMTIAPLPAPPDRD